MGYCALPNVYELLALLKNNQTRFSGKKTTLRFQSSSSSKICEESVQYSTGEFFQSQIWRGLLLRRENDFKVSLIGTLGGWDLTPFEIAKGRFTRPLWRFNLRSHMNHKSLTFYSFTLNSFSLRVWDLCLPDWHGSPDEIKHFQIMTVTGKKCREKSCKMIGVPIRNRKNLNWITLGWKNEFWGIN